ncbi:glycosyltransferase family 4 protein [Thiotrichales bacterium 19S9-12]|nr:glycosyltransferase family 4 protein [Thiotrichales bacterium 19S9-11]MCF6810953.1 glycosyltransferase family 4 protein [Thiotrichales bacterium 19S9-12]
MTILHSGEKTVLSDSHLYKEIITKTKKLGPFFIQQSIFSVIRRGNYDIIVAMHDLRWLMNFLAKLVYRKKYPFVWWGLDFSRSNFINRLKLLSVKGKSPVIFYCDKIKHDFINYGLKPQEKLFFANNTFTIRPKNRIKSFKIQDKTLILFVGSMDARKQNDSLLRAFAKVKNDIPEDLYLCFVGAGSQLGDLKALALKLNIEKQVQFEGAITDTELLEKYYKHALFSISFGQAGLSVLQSMGYGVAFVTKKNAITGGELSNIVDGKNGILCEDNMASLETVIKRLANDKAYCLEMGANAYDYYDQYCTVENMVAGFSKALSFAEDSH